MATKSRSSKLVPKGRTTFRAGPPKGVRTDNSPYSDALDLLTEGLNLVFPDSSGNVGCVQRAGFNLFNAGTAVYAPGVAFKGQCIYSHPMLDGSRINFIIMGGQLFRLDGSSFTNVTPVGVTIDSALETIVYGISLDGNLAFTDGVNRPWIASALTSTPITGTYIDYDGAGVSWTTVGAPALYGGAPFWILNQVGGISRRTDVSWANPGFLDVGYQQTDFDNNWTLETTSASPLFAIFGTNEALYYWRALSIGKATGTVGPNLASGATEDSVTFNVGTQSARSLQQFGNAFFFIDSIGRPWRYVPGEAPQPIWTQMQTYVAQNATGAPEVISHVATSAIEPTNNKYLVGIWSVDSTSDASVAELYSFDASTGVFEGRWVIGDGISIDCIGSFTDSTGRVTIIVIGSKVASGATGYVWYLNSTGSNALIRTTMPAVPLTRTTMAGLTRTTMSQTVTFTDNAVNPMTVKAVSPRFQYNDSVNLNVDTATVVTTSVAPVSVAIVTSSQTSTVQGTPTPSTSYDGTYRLYAGTRGFGRGPRVVVIPQTTTTQWGLQSIAITAAVSGAFANDS